MPAGNKQTEYEKQTALLAVVSINTLNFSQLSDNRHMHSLEFFYTKKSPILTMMYVCIQRHIQLPHGTAHTACREKTKQEARETGARP